ncbi:MAG: hypothetical protein HQK57_15390, partial [Deltaproteobacteria bacterium]|nr:hypothetical protein [Deltaproteobacteria bacterium]
MKTDQDGQDQPRLSANVSLMRTFLQVRVPVAGRKPSVTVMRARVTDLLRQARADGDLDRIVRQVISFVGLESFLPPSYARFQVVLTEGMVFLLASLSLARLAEKIVDQLQLPFTASLGRRVFTLVLDMPTLQKLGQVIARNPNLDPVFKQALVDLEDNLKTVTFEQVKLLLDKEIGRPRHGFSITPEPGILAEASVCAVVPAEVAAPTGHSFRAVLKVVKPKVTKNIGSELILLDRLAVFLDRHREEWGVGGFLFQATFTEVKKAIRSEMNLAGEQDNLDQAGIYYGGDQSLLVPARLPASTPRMTAMTRIDGTKITDVAGLTSRERWLLAAALARICILRPIQDTKDESIFHGDPHAGNLAYTFEGGRPRIILYDWAMIGKLNRVDRLAMVMLTLGLIMGNKKAVFYASDIITKGQLSADPALGDKIQRSINEVISSRGMKVTGAMSAIERLFEDFTYHGVIFSSD